MRKLKSGDNRWKPILFGCVNSFCVNWEGCAWRAAEASGNLIFDKPSLLQTSGIWHEQIWLEIAFL